MDNHKNISELVDLSNKTAIVTGGAMGIGLGIVKRFVEAGASVVIADVDESAAQSAAEEIASMDGELLVLPTDVSKKSDAQNLVDKTVEELGGIDILVNNAGIFPSIPVQELTEEDFKKIIDINLTGTYLCSKYASKQMIEQGNGGKIINITSIDALHPSMVGLAAYDASKHGVWGFTKNLALELAEHEIWVNAIAPGGIATPGTGAGDNEVDEAISDNVEKFLSQIPMHRMGDPDEIGRAALFLASDLSSYMTGSQVVVDGGALLS